MISLDELCKEHYQRVYNRAKFLVSDADLALEVTQEVFIRVTKAYPTLREENNIPAWLWAVTTNLVRDMRKKRHVQVISMETLTHTPDGKINDGWHPISGPDTQFHWVLIKEGLRDMEAALTPRQLVCFKARLAGYSFDEIAERTGITRWAVSMCLKRGAVRMQEYRAEREQRAS